MKKLKEIKAVKIELPMKEADRKRLRVGMFVHVSGVIYTARDAAHKKIYDAILAKKSLPFRLEGAAIYYVGPAPCPPDRMIGPCGPTTSYRMDKYTPLLLKNGLRVMIGKGERNNEVLKAIKKTCAVYLVTIGGIASLLAEKVVSNKLVAYPELGPEAVRELVVKDFPCFVKNI